MQNIPINASSRQNFQTLLSAVRADRICLMSAFDTMTNEPVFLVCAVNVEPQSDECFEFIPIAVLCNEDPYQRFRPPMAGNESADVQETS